MRWLAKRPENDTYICFLAHNVLFWASETADGLRGCGVCIQVNSVTISG